MKKPIARKSTTADNAAYLYLCDCHSVPATKPSCVKVDKKTAETQTLGSWRCSTSQKPCKVRRVNQPVKA
jgi:hypothetical protein